MQLIREEVRGVAVIRPQGEFIDSSNASAFRKAVTAECRADTCVLLDLAGMRWVDSGGCGALLAICRELRQRGGDLKLCGVAGPVRLLFQVIQLHRLCDIFNTVAEGVAAFGVEAIAS